jgi:hypothetical protein
VCRQEEEKEEDKKRMWKGIKRMTRREDVNEEMK